MKIRRINLIDGNYVRVGDFATECHSSKEFLITEIKETVISNGHTPDMYGFAPMHNEIQLTLIPYHAVTMVFFEVENDI